MAGLTVPKGDFGYYINFTVTDDDDAAYNLSGYTVTLKIWDPNNPEHIQINKESQEIVLDTLAKAVNG